MIIQGVAGGLDYSYMFLFILAGVWIFAAAVQDVRKREVSNWLNFSLIAFALVFKLLYSSNSGSWGVFWFALLGFAVCFVIACAFYYGGMLGGGDAKLLMGVGAVLPIFSYSSLAAEIGGFLILLFFVGSLYSLVYSAGLAISGGRRFVSELRVQVRHHRMMIALGLFFALTLLFFVEPLSLGLVLGLAMGSLALMFVYLNAIDKACMVQLTSPGKLSEGDWLDRAVSVNGRKIGKDVQGLSWKEIGLLRKTHRKVWIKQGIPFVPAFLISWIIMGFAYLILGLTFSSLLASLF